jgi:hypothetical protein
VDSAEAWRTFHKWATIAWAAFLPVALLTPLKESLPLIVGISIYANIVGHWSSYQASRAESKG